MPIVYEPYAEQVKVWPRDGRHILAQYDDKIVVVYQAYNPAIGRYAVEHGRFGGDFSFARMSWVKPNFLWMMFRNGWGTKENLIWRPLSTGRTRAPSAGTRFQRVTRASAPSLVRTR